MFDQDAAAYVFTALTSIVVLFQLSLSLGAPWGEMAMGGKYPGKFPPKLRIAAVVQMTLLIFIALVVLSRAGVMLDSWHGFSKTAIWFVVALSAVSAVLNIITPSKKERMLWGPVTVVMFVCAVTVALG